MKNSVEYNPYSKKALKKAEKSTHQEPVERSTAALDQAPTSASQDSLHRRKFSARDPS